MADGLLGGECTFVVVAYDAPQQSVVAHGNPVVVVQRDAGERGDVNLELHRVGNLLREQRVQCVNTLDDKHAVVGQLHLLAIILALASHKVVFGHLHALAFH